jgi:hypothetical protein
MAGEFKYNTSQNKMLCLCFGPADDRGGSSAPLSSSQVSKLLCDLACDGLRRNHPSWRVCKVRSWSDDCARRPAGVRSAQPFAIHFCARFLFYLPSVAAACFGLACNVCSRSLVPTSRHLLDIVTGRFSPKTPENPARNEVRMATQLPYSRCVCFRERR